MNCFIHKPKGLLSEYVKSIWIMDNFKKCCNDICIPLIPSGCVEIVIHFDGKGKYSVNNSSDHLITNASASGQKLNQKKYYSINSAGILAVILQPDASNIILGMPSNLISNTTINLTDVFGNSVNNLIEQIHNETDKNTIISNVEKFFTSKIVNTKDTRIAQFVKDISSSGGCNNLLKVASELNLSLRQLERKVFEVVGISPKEFSRIVRFQKSLFIKQHNPKINLTSLSYECGYFDQSHFIKEFKSISGYAPKEFFKLSPAFSDYYSL